MKTDKYIELKYQRAGDEGLFLVSRRKYEVDSIPVFIYFIFPKNDF